jgi:hypothetical protein
MTALDRAYRAYSNEDLTTWTPCQPYLTCKQMMMVRWLERQSNVT